MKKFIAIIITILMSVVSYAQNTKTIDFNNLNWGFNSILWGRPNTIYRLDDGRVAFQHKNDKNKTIERFAVSDSVFFALYEHYAKNFNELEKALESLYEKAEKKYPFISEINTNEYELLKEKNLSNLSINDLDYIKWYDSLVKRYGRSFIEKLDDINSNRFVSIKKIGVCSFDIEFSIGSESQNSGSRFVINHCYGGFVVFPKDNCNKYLKEYKTLVYSVL